MKTSPVMSISKWRGMRGKGLPGHAQNAALLVADNAVELHPRTLQHLRDCTDTNSLLA